MGHVSFLSHVGGTPLASVLKGACLVQLFSVGRDFNNYSRQIIRRAVVNLGRAGRVR